MAGTWGAAHALARFVARPTIIVPLDQSGRAIAHLPAWALRLPDGMAELIQVRRAFAEPISAPETMARYTLTLVEALCHALEAKGLGARTLDLRFHRVDNHIVVVRVGLSKPIRTIKTLTRLLCDKLEAVDPGFGVDTMVLAAPIAEPLTWKPVSTDLAEAAVPNTKYGDRLSCPHFPFLPISPN